MTAKYDLNPQMREYNRLGILWHPYLMYFHKPNYNSSVVNTDKQGFRITYKKQNRINDFASIQYEPVNLLVGNSFSFGVGATHDKNTIPSILNEHSDELWLNFSGRGFNSTQELLLFQFFHQQFSNLQRVVVLSGVNNLSFSYRTKQTTDLGPFYYQDRFTEQMNANLSLKQKIVKTLLYPFYRNTLDYTSIRSFDFKELSHCLKPSTLAPSQLQQHVLDVLKRDIASWRFLSTALNIKIDFIFQPFFNWVQKDPAKEEILLIIENTSQGYEEILREKMTQELYYWYSAAVENICRENGIGFLDLNKVLSAKKLDKKWLFVDRVHFTDLGNKIVATILDEYLSATYKIFQTPPSSSCLVE